MSGHSSLYYNWTMEELTIIRTEDDGIRTMGIVEPFGFHCLEPPWKNNQFRISCIPEGQYMIRPHISPSRGKCLYVYDTSPRTYILWHSGNVVKHTMGCALIGRRRGYLYGEPAVLVSRSAMNEVLEQVRRPTPLTIVKSPI